MIEGVRFVARRSAGALLLALCLGSVPCGPASAVPALLNYQGHLSNGGGPLTGNFPMTFALFTVPAGGTPLWSESYANVTVTAGVFNVLLGSDTPLPLGSLFTGQTLYIETTVSGNVLSPRRPIVSVGYAARAAIADSAAAAPGSGAVTYTRWGRSDCPVGASVVYSGYAASGHYQQPGAARNLLCLTDSPSYDSYSDLNQNGALLYGTEYQTNGYGLTASPWPSVHNFSAPCVVCLRENARISLMIPGSKLCPAGWNLEYSGYLMGTHYTQSGGGGELVCVDRLPAAIGNVSLQGGNLWYPTEAECGSLPCAPYVQDREVTCAVCTRP